jgi:hypothetical protein
MLDPIYFLESLGMRDDLADQMVRIWEFGFPGEDIAWCPFEAEDVEKEGIGAEDGCWAGYMMNLVVETRDNVEEEDRVVRLGGDCSDLVEGMLLALVVVAQGRICEAGIPLVAGILDS